MRTPIKTNNTSSFQKTSSSQDTSPLWGILEGKRKAKKTAAKIAELQAQTAAEVATTEQNIKLEETTQTGDKTLYMVLGLVVVTVMVGLYFIKKR